MPLKAINFAQFGHGKVLTQIVDPSSEMPFFEASAITRASAWISIERSIDSPFLEVIRGSLSINDVYSVGTDELWDRKQIVLVSSIINAPKCLHQFVLCDNSSFNACVIGSSSSIFNILSGLICCCSVELSLSHLKNTGSWVISAAGLAAIILRVISSFGMIIGCFNA